MKIGIILSFVIKGKRTAGSRRSTAESSSGSGSGNGRFGLVIPLLALATRAASRAHDVASYRLRGVRMAGLCGT